MPTRKTITATKKTATKKTATKKRTKRRVRRLSLFKPEGTQTRITKIVTGTTFAELEQRINDLLATQKDDDTGSIYVDVHGCGMPIVKGSEVGVIYTIHTWTPEAKLPPVLPPSADGAGDSTPEGAQA